MRTPRASSPRLAAVWMTVAMVAKAAAPHWERKPPLTLQGTPELRTPEGSVLAGQLQHVVATYDGARATFYLDGQPVADTTHFAGDAGIGTLQNWDETMHFMLGNEFTGERLWSGAIHLVAFYTQALTAEQVQANFQAGL